MGRAVTVDATEPVFEVPPRLGLQRDRRMAGRAAARWTRLRGDAAMPSVSGYVADREALADLASHDLVLDLTDPWQVAIDHVGGALARVFGIETGRVADAGPSSLERSVLAAAATARQRPALVPFEALLQGSGQATPLLLTRGVLMPLADQRGRLAAAHVVVTWKEKLSITQNRALERELRLILVDFPRWGRPDTPKT